MIGAFDELFALVNFSLSNIKVLEPRKSADKSSGILLNIHVFRRGHINDISFIEIEMITQ